MIIPAQVRVLSSFLLLSKCIICKPAFTRETFSGAIPEKRGLHSREYNASVPRWEWWPNVGPLPGNPTGKYLELDSGVSVWYAEMGHRNHDKSAPVMLLHGGTVNSNWMWHQAHDLVKDHYVISMDTRGQGRSPYLGFTEMHYDDMARDAIAVLDHLNVSKAAIVGWSDGAVTGLNMAMNYTDRVDRVFAHGANAQTNYSIPEYGTFDQLGGPSSLSRRQDDEDPYSYASLSPTPEKQEEMEAAVFDMWLTEPNWGADAFALIEAPVWIVAGDRDVIDRNQPDAMASWTPFAGELILPQVGHNALNEDWVFFNLAIRRFLETDYDGQLPVYS